MKTAVVTGADGGMGTEITRALARAGYRVLMACCNTERAEAKRAMLVADTGNPNIEVRKIDLASLATVRRFADRLLAEGTPISLLMNNAGTLQTGRYTTEDGLERTVSVNYVGPYLLTRLLLPLMSRGTRVVNMVSCTYALGRLTFPEFFTLGRRGTFWRIPVYANTKLALTLFTLRMAEQLRDRGITVNAADPGVVSTDIITMHMWFDPLTDILFRPFIRKPAKGAATAIHLLLDDDVAAQTGTLNASCHPVRLSDKYLHHPQSDELWTRTEAIVRPWLPAAE